MAKIRCRFCQQTFVLPDDPAQHDSAWQRLRQHVWAAHWRMARAIAAACRPIDQVRRGFEDVEAIAEGF